MNSKCLSVHLFSDKVKPLCKTSLFYHALCLKGRHKSPFFIFLDFHKIRCCGKGIAFILLLLLLEGHTHTHAHTKLNKFFVTFFFFSPACKVWGGWQDLIFGLLLEFILSRHHRDWLKSVNRRKCSVVLIYYFFNSFGRRCLEGPPFSGSVPVYLITEKRASEWT